MSETTSAVNIETVVHGGHGLARIDGQVWFVPGALPGDVAELRLLERRKGVGWAAIARLVTPSEHRTAAECDVYGRCGGCDWLHFSYPGQGEWKLRMTRECLQRIGGIDCDLAFVGDPELRLGYRTRARFHSRGPGAVGFYAPKSHDVVPIASCPLCHPRLNEALSRLHGADFHGDAELAVHPESGEVLAWAQGDRAALGRLFPQPEQRAEGRASFQFDGRPIVAGGFSQSSLLLNRLLTSTVENMLEGARAVLDLYCGNGNLTLGLPDGVNVLGLDQDRAVVAAADAQDRGTYSACRENGFVSFIRQGEWDAIVLDPPRAGAKAIIGALAVSRAERLVYVSCNPATLARDLRELAGSEWSVSRGAVIDLFPQTPHVETAVLVERR